MNARLVIANETAGIDVSPFSCTQRSAHQLIRRRDFLDQPDRERFGRLDGVGAKYEAAEACRRQSRPHDLKRQRRGRRTNRQLGNPDAPRALSRWSEVPAGQCRKTRAEQTHFGRVTSCLQVVDDFSEPDPVDDTALGLQPQQIEGGDGEPFRRLTL